MRPFRNPLLTEIEELYRQRFGHFARAAAAITHDRDLAVEAVQDAFADVVRSRRHYRREGPLEAWVWRAVVNAAVKARARAARAPIADDVPARRRGPGRRPSLGARAERQASLRPARHGSVGRRRSSRHLFD